MQVLVADPSAHGETRASERLTKALEWPMALLALAVIPALLLDDGAATPRVHLLATSINWFVWVAFCADFVVRLAAAPNRIALVRSSWFDLLVIAISPPFGVPEGLQGIRAIRALRLFRLLRFFRAAAFLSIGLRATRRVLRHRRFHYVLVVMGGVVVFGAVGLYIVERNVNDGVTSFGDALWWAVTTATTVGYGDIYPKTGEGRLIAVLLMVTGIGVIGIFTATIANFFIIQDEETEFAAVQRRLDDIEMKLDCLLARGSKEHPTVANYTVDRFEGDWAVLEDDQRRTFNVPKRWLPSDAREGAVLVVSYGAADGTASAVRFELDPVATDQRLAEARRLRDQLPRAPKGDISL